MPRLLTHGMFAYEQVPDCPSWGPNERSRAPRPLGFQPIRGASPLQLLRPDLSPPSAARAGSHNPQSWGLGFHGVTHGTPNQRTSTTKSKHGDPHGASKSAPSKLWIVAFFLELQLGGLPSAFQSYSFANMPSPMMVAGHIRCIPFLGEIHHTSSTFSDTYRFKIRCTHSLLL